MTFKDDITGNPKIAIYVLCGVGIGILITAAQNAIHYITNQDEISYLGASAINCIIGLFAIIVFIILKSKLETSERAELLKIPDKVRK